MALTFSSAASAPHAEVATPSAPHAVWQWWCDARGTAGHLKSYHSKYGRKLEAQHLTAAAAALAGPAWTAGAAGSEGATGVAEAAGVVVAAGTVVWIILAGYASGSAASSVGSAEVSASDSGTGAEAEGAVGAGGAGGVIPAHAICGGCLRRALLVVTNDTIKVPCYPLLASTCPSPSLTPPMCAHLHRTHPSTMFFGKNKHPHPPQYSHTHARRPNLTLSNGPRWPSR